MRKSIIENNNDEILKSSSCCRVGEDGSYYIEAIPISSKEFAEDFSSFLKEKKNNLAYGYYDGYDDDRGYWDDLRDYWGGLMGYNMEDDEYEAYMEAMYGYRSELDDDDYEQVWPLPKKGKKNYITRKDPFSSQKFINGIEVSDDEFEDYNKALSSLDDDDLFSRKSKTRRGGKKHGNKRRVTKRDRYGTLHTSTRYVQDDWDNEHQNPNYDNEYDMGYNTFDDYDREYVDQKKHIVFYNTIGDDNDTQEWESLLEFNEWVQENNIEITDSAAKDLLYREESHCCLDPTTTSNRLVVERTYGDLVWEITGGDEDLIRKYSQNSYRRL